MGNLQYKNNAKVQNGLEALKFASELEFRPFASKIFMVLDTVAVYTGSLRKMVETNNLLVKKAIILNVINKYKFKKSKHYIILYYIILYYLILYYIILYYIILYYIILYYIILYYVIFYYII